jgi:hypothetical protein
VKIPKSYFSWTVKKEVLNNFEKSISIHAIGGSCWLFRKLIFTQTEP